MSWISVKDKLPERKGLEDDETEYVLVFIPFRSFSGGYVSICGYDKDGWSVWDNFGSINVSDITHWQPLPEPPKEKQKQ